jgi:hypothetical protein
LNVPTDAIIVIIFLEYGGTMMAENPVPLSFGEMACERTRELATELPQTNWKRMIDLDA